MLGGADPLGDNHARLPLATVNADGSLTLVFDCLQQTERGAADLAVEYGSDLNGWLAAAVPARAATVNGVVFTIAGAGLRHVAATIPQGRPARGQLFGRLKATLP